MINIPLPARPASPPSPQKRKLQAVNSDAESLTLSPTSRRRLGTLANSRSKPDTSRMKAMHSGYRNNSEEAAATHNFGYQTVPLKIEGPRRSSQSQTTPKDTSPWKHRNFSVFSPSSFKSPARHMRVLSRHIRQCQIFVASNATGAQKSDTRISLTQIPSIMDVYLDAKSPSIDFTEEILLEIADRSRRPSLLPSLDLALAPSQTQSPCSYQHCEYHHTVNSDSLSSSLASELTGLNPSWEQILLGQNVTHSGNLTRHPDSFMRSTATWSEELNGP
ncbi:hypothetical protein J3R30DRAFT_2737288 [Lentinula aciculospora]|uniref:Uncharacterized protein n=1 Tax=Lentinula aciculospora TaxID=153920 RepID=A0A9W9DPC7_9AGAR|nr:hypothetical protein J3R30DRAFT_2737288 [Lentinula aciculospora]